MKLTVRKFHEQTDLPVINHWLNLRFHNPLTSEDVPMHAFIVSNNNDPIAAGFLRLIEGRNAIFDFLVTNPEAPSTYRDVAIGLVGEEIIKAARKRKIKRIIAYSIDTGTLTRAVRSGYVQLPHKLVALDLKSISTGE